MTLTAWTNWKTYYFLDLQQPYLTCHEVMNAFVAQMRILEQLSKGNYASHSGHQTLSPPASVEKLWMPFVHLASNANDIDTEPPALVDGQPNLRPFDIGILLNNTAGNRTWRTKLFRLGLDVTFIPSTAIYSTPTPAFQTCVSNHMPGRCRAIARQT